MMRRALVTALSLPCLFASTAQARPAIFPFATDSLDKIVSAHKGRPFVLFVWSLDCVFCKASISELARHQQKAPRFDVVTVATDAAGDPDIQAQLIKRLEAAGLGSTNWAYGEAPSEQLNYAIDPKWHGELPRSYWYDGQGKRVAYSGVLTSQMIAKLSAQSRN